MHFWNKFDVNPICCSMKATMKDKEEYAITNEPMKVLFQEERRQLEIVVNQFPKAGEGKLDRTNIYEL